MLCIAFIQILLFIVFVGFAKTTLTTDGLTLPALDKRQEYEGITQENFNIQLLALKYAFLFEGLT
jgi:hypothetical protein